MTQQDSAARPSRSRGEAKPPPAPPLTPQEEAAIAFARDNRDSYPKRYRNKELQFSVVNAEPRDDGNMLVRLIYRPSGNFSGRPGEELILIAPNADVIERTQIHAPRENFPWVLGITAVAVLLAAPILIWLVLTQDDRNVDPLYVAGRILYMRLVEPELVPAIHYQNPDTAGNLTNWEILPQNPDNVLAIVKTTLINDKTAHAVVVIDENAAILMTDDGRSFRPINILTESKPITTIDNSLLQSTFVGLWNTVSIRKKENVIGWMVFEVPRGSEFREFRWTASDTITVRFGK